MPRYVDADELIKKIFPYEVIDKKSYAINAKAVYEAIKNAPAADVVPRELYDEVMANWQKIHDSYTADCLEHYNKGRSDAAREIFGEIERVAMSKIDENAPISTLDDTVYIQAIDEVRQKYTEG